MEDRETPPFASSSELASPGAIAPPADPAAFGQRVSGALRQRIGEERFDLWFDRKTRFTLAGNTLVVEAGNGFAARWILSKFQQDLLSAARQTMGHDLSLEVRVAEVVGKDTLGEVSPDQTSVPTPCASAPSKSPTAAATLPSPINARYTLEEFVVGPSNQLAYHAACRVAQEPGRQFNPLFLYGHCGLGKTHLLQGICQRFARLHPQKKWLYLTGEQFTNDFLEALRLRKTDAFRRRIRGAELLVIDDVHFLANKKATQEEFLHTFNQVDASGRQIVLASDCAPRQIHALSEHLSSRFISGMVLRVDSPDLPTRLEILRRRVARNNWSISDAVLMHIAQSATSSVREMEGLLLQAIAGISLINAGSADAVTILSRLRERTAMRAPVSAERILASVADHFGVTAQTLLGNGREKIVSIARGVAMYLARQHSGMSFPEIGRAMGNKNHSTVIAACQRIEALISGGGLLCWNTPAGARHQAIADVLHDLEAAVRRARV